MVVSASMLFPMFSDILRAIPIFTCMYEKVPIPIIPLKSVTSLLVPSYQQAESGLIHSLTFFGKASLTTVQVVSYLCILS